MAETGRQKAFESQGIFWLPGESDPQTHGQLSYTPDDGPRLCLVGGLDSSLIEDHPVVHGCLDNAPCTLFNCRQVSSKNSHRGLRQVVIKADLLLVGEHVDSLDHAVFDGAKARFGGLDEWVDFSSVETNTPVGDNAKFPTRFELVTQPPVITKSKEMGGVVTLCGQQSGSFDCRRIDLKYHSFFDVAFDKPASIRALQQCIFELQHLFVLLTWHHAPVSYLSAIRSVSKDAMNPTGKRRSGLYGHWDVASQEDKPSSHFLTYLAHVMDDLPQIISSWFRSPKVIKTARHLLTSIGCSTGQYVEFQFLALMQIVEALHRSLDSRSYMSPADYEIVRQTLVQAIPHDVGPDLRSSLKSRIKFGNELSLRTRFKELFRRLPNELCLHICSDWEAFVGQAVDMRNALTHPITDGTTAEPDPTHLWQASQRIKLLLTIVLLEELGFSFDKISRVAASEQWQSLVRD